MPRHSQQSSLPRRSTLDQKRSTCSGVRAGIGLVLDIGVVSEERINALGADPGN